MIPLATCTALAGYVAARCFVFPVPDPQNNQHYMQIARTVTFLMLLAIVSAWIRICREPSRSLPGFAGMIILAGMWDIDQTDGQVLYVATREARIPTPAPPHGGRKLVRRAEAVGSR